MGRHELKASNDLRSLALHGRTLLFSRNPTILSGAVAALLKKKYRSIILNITTAIFLFVILTYTIGDYKSLSAE